MNILQNVSLAGYSTMGLGGTAAYLTAITSRAELTEAVEWAKSRQLPIIMIGGGSNIIWKDEGFSGLVLINKVPGYDQQDIDENSSSFIIGAGENWDSVVQRSVEAGFTGIETLSLVPGSAGATPIQNVGAYGQEISESLTTVEAYDTQTGQFVTLAGSDCNFSYRNSRFKNEDRGRFFILGITLQLSKANPIPPFYGAVQTYLDENNLADVTPAVLRQTVIAIRTAKLPDPAVIKNTGSFFANPIIPKAQFDQLYEENHGIRNWPVDDDSTKISAAWLIEQSGYKDHHDADTGMSTWPNQALVLVNEKARDTADLLAYKAKIVDAVQVKFGITLVQEPELLP